MGLNTKNKDMNVDIHTSNKLDSESIIQSNKLFDNINFMHSNLYYGIINRLHLIQKNIKKTSLGKSGYSVG